MARIKEASKWLQTSWWGLLIAYLLILFLVYIGLWSLNEPIKFFEGLDVTNFLRSGTFAFLAITFLIASHLVLLLDLFFRRKLWGELISATDMKILTGTWKGQYYYDGKERTATLKIHKEEKVIKADIATVTGPDDVVIQKSIGRLSFHLVLTPERLELQPSRTKKWRPETWRCAFSLDKTGHELLEVEISDISSQGDTRIIAKTKLFRVN